MGKLWARGAKQLNNQTIRSYAQNQPPCYQVRNHQSPYVTLVVAAQFQSDGQACEETRRAGCPLVLAQVFQPRAQARGPVEQTGGVHKARITIQQS